MDNVTHSLFGVALGETYWRYTKKHLPEWEQEKARVPLIITSLIGSNLPDLDFLYAWMLGGKKLGYLVHHRGYTHSLLAAFLAALLGWGIYQFFGKKRQVWSRRFQVIFAVCCTVSVALHVGLDALNSYGVHPFWPWNRNWYYGDTLFIVEPWIWVTLSIPLVFLYESKVTKWIFSVLAIIAIILCGFSDRVPAEIALAIFAFSAFFVWALKRMSASLQLFALWVSFFAIVGLFHFTSRNLKERLRQDFLSEVPGTELRDIVLSPFPGNPFCWMVVTVETYGTAVNYGLERGIAAPYEGGFSVDRCQKASLFPQKTEIRRSSHMIWTDSWEGGVKSLQGLVADSCQAKQFLQFSRAPFFQTNSSGIQMGDYRFWGRAKTGFAQVDIKANETCPPHVYPWVPPRQDLLSLE